MQMPDHSLYLDNHCSQSVEIVQAMLYICLIIVFIGIIVVHDKLKLGCYVVLMPDHGLY